jgi:hypothetical protein
VRVNKAQSVHGAQTTRAYSRFGIGCYHSILGELVDDTVGHEEEQIFADVVCAHNESNRAHLLLSTASKILEHGDWLLNADSGDGSRFGYRNAQQERF